MNRMRVAAIVAVGIGVVADTAAADIIFDNGGPNAATGGVLSDLDAGVRAGDDFVLQVNASTITGIQWWGFHLEVPTAADDFTIEIYEIVAGLPAASPLYSLNVGAASRQEIEPLVYGYEATVAPIELMAGQTYALSIFNASAPGIGDDWSWYTSGEGSGFQWLDAEPPGVSSRDFAFALTGPIIPAPGSLALLGLAALGAGGRRRR